MSADSHEALSGAVIADEKTEPSRDELQPLLRAPSSRARATGATGAAVVLGRIVALESQASVIVEIPAVSGARAARIAVPLSENDLVAARDNARAAVLVFENGDPELPIIVGLMQSVQPDRGSAVPQVLEADVDGKRVRITAQDEIVLECGSASITLRRNGRVVVRGTYVESYSDGTNRIKGGQVRIN